MFKFVRIIGLSLSLVLLSTTLAACGGTPADAVAPFSAATQVQVDQTTQESFKSTVKGVKDANLTAYDVKGKADDIKTYYDTAYTKAGWTSRADAIKDAATQQTSQSGWSLAYEKGTDIVSLTLSPGTVANATFPSVDTADNLLLVITATK